MQEEAISELRIEDQNLILITALLDIYNIYMTFDYPKAEDFGMIAKAALQKVGRV